MQFPARDTTLSCSQSIYLEGHYFRLEEDGLAPYLNRKRPGIVPVKRTTVFDGNIVKDYAPALGLTKFETGTIDDVDLEHGRILTMPIMWTFRPTHPKLGVVDLDGLIRTKKPASVDGRRCIVLLKPSAAGRTEYWVDPQRDFVILRYLVYADSAGKQLVQSLDVSYEEHATAGWTPVRWQSMMQFGNSLGQSSNVRVVKSSINPALDPGLFDLRFPVGTRIRDRRAGRDDFYFQMRNNQLYAISESQLKQSVRYMEAIDPKSHKARRIVVYFTSGGGILLVVCALLLWRWRNQRALRKNESGEAQP